MFDGEILKGFSSCGNPPARHFQGQSIIFDGNIEHENRDLTILMYTPSEHNMV